MNKHFLIAYKTLNLWAFGVVLAALWPVERLEEAA